MLQNHKGGGTHTHMKAEFWYVLTWRSLNALEEVSQVTRDKSRAVFARLSIKICQCGYFQNAGFKIIFAAAFFARIFFSEIIVT